MAKQSVTPSTAWLANSTDPYADQSNQDGQRAPVVGNVPELTNPDYVLTEDFEATQPAVFDKDANVTWAEVDSTDAGNKVLSADYTTEGIQGDDSAWSEMEIQMPINAVQVILKFREYTPSGYTSADAANHKSVGFWSGGYAITAANISINTECWPRTGGASPSMYTGHDGVNYGHMMTAGDPLLWLDGDDDWHDSCIVVELADGGSAFGRYRYYRDDILLIDSNPGNGMANSGVTGDTAQETLGFATRGNFVDRVRMFGWANPETLNGGTPAYAGTMHFLYDDLELTANSTFKPIVEPV